MFGESDGFYEELAETRRLLSGAHYGAGEQGHLSDRYCTPADILTADREERLRDVSGLRAPNTEL